MSDSRISTRTPLRILCQHDHGSCAACCGVYNFRDRSPAAERARLARRTAMVREAWPDVEKLAQARDALLEIEREEILFAGVKVCPFAGYVDDERVGCMIHPSRHPSGDDLRDLAVYPKEVCAGHFCAPHDWLRDREIDVAQTATGTFYGVIVTDAGLVKALAKILDDKLARPFTRADVERFDWAPLWDLLRTWPWRDPDPARFGGFVFAGNEATERSVPSCVAGVTFAVDNARRTILDALGTRPLDDDEARAALAALEEQIDRLTGSRSDGTSPSAS